MPSNHVAWRQAARIASEIHIRRQLADYLFSPAVRASGSAKESDFAAWHIPQCNCVMRPAQISLIARQKCYVRCIQETNNMASNSDFLFTRKRQEAKNATKLNTFSMITKSQNTHSLSECFARDTFRLWQDMNTHTLIFSYLHSDGR